VRLALQWLQRILKLEERSARIADHLRPIVDQPNFGDPQRADDDDPHTRRAADHSPQLSIERT
jgi:hypothetical protein